MLWQRFESGMFIENLFLRYRLLEVDIHVPGGNG